MVALDIRFLCAVAGKLELVAGFVIRRFGRRNVYLVFFFGLTIAGLAVNRRAACKWIVFYCACAVFATACVFRLVLFAGHKGELGTIEFLVPALVVLCAAPKIAFVAALIRMIAVVMLGFVEAAVDFLVFAAIPREFFLVKTLAKIKLLAVTCVPTVLLV